MEEPILLSDPFFAFPTMAYPPPPPPCDEAQLVILRQNSLAVEKVSQNGIQKNVHVVVKNQPFLIQVAPVYAGSIDFTATPLEVRLLYDCDKLKEVDFVKLKPLEARCHVNERGDQVTMEIRLKVLSSQLEDMFFRLRLVAVDSVTKQRLDEFSVVSEPIKVVSKPEQAKKRKVAPAVAVPVSQHPLLQLTQQLPQQLPKDKKEKKDKQEFLADKLGRVEGTVLQQQQLLAELQRQNELQRLQNAQLIQQLQMANLKAEKRAQEAQWEVVNAKKNNKKEQEATPSAAFEAAFNTFMASYDKVPYEEKSERIRRVMRNTGMRDTEVVCEMLDLFAAEGLQRTVMGGRSPSSSSSSSSSSSCNNNHSGTGETCGCQECPFKKELERIDDFYNDFLSTPSIL